MPLSDDTRSTVDWALSTIYARRAGYVRFRDYYAGDQERMMSDRRLAKIFAGLFDDFALNLCQPVVDSLADRLEVASFSAGEDADQSDEALDVWKRNRMGRRAPMIHGEAITTGDSYVIVWTNPDGQATIYPHRAEQMAVEYDENRPGTLLRAAKLWRDNDMRDRLTVYYPDRLERFATVPKPHGAGSFADGTSGAFDYYDDPDDTGGPVVTNPYGVVPVFHFANNADIGDYGTSELYNAIKVQNALNFQAFHMLVGTEFQGFRQRYATGIELPRDADGNVVNPFVAGAEEVWVAGHTGEGPAPTFGEFSASDLNQLDNVKRSWALDMATVTQTPAHYFQSTTNMVSGESQKTAEQKLTAKANARKAAFGDVWAEAVALALRMEQSGEVELDTNWKDLTPRNELESWTIAEVKAELGVSRAQILRELGYSQEQIESFASEDAELGLGSEAPDPLRAFASGVLGGTNGNGLGV